MPFSQGIHLTLTLFVFQSTLKYNFIVYSFFSIIQSKHVFRHICPSYGLFFNDLEETESMPKPLSPM